MAHALRYLIGSLVLPVLWSAAAEPAVPPLRFTVFSARPLENLVLLGRPDMLPVPLTFYPTARSPEYEHPAETPLKIGDGPTGELVAEASIPASIRRALLFFLPNPVGTEPGKRRYQIQILDDSTLRLVTGHLAVLNLSGLKLSGTIGQRRLVLGEGLNPPFRVGESAEIALQITLNNRRYWSYRDTVALAPGQRALLVLFPPFYRGSLEVQGRLLIDTPLAEPVQE